ncbi:hypothetical protein LINPERHAP1_LOCUS30766 [Linum perenne]
MNNSPKHQGKLISHVDDTTPGQCYCGVGVVVRQSRTSSNPNRPFYGCRNWSRKGLDGCGFFKWCDSVNCVKAESSTMDQLLMENTNLKEKIAVLQLTVVALEEKLARLETNKNSLEVENGESDDSADIRLRVARLEKIMVSALNI